MDVVIANVPSVDDKTFPAANLLEYSFHLGFDILVLQDLASIPWCPDQMVLTGVCAMLQSIDATIAQKNHLLSLGGGFIVHHELRSKRTPQLKLGVFKGNKT